MKCKPGGTAGRIGRMHANGIRALGLRIYKSWPCLVQVVLSPEQRENLA